MKTTTIPKTQTTSGRREARQWIERQLRWELALKALRGELTPAARRAA